MRIAIFGAGGAGGYFGAQLANAGEDVVFIARGKHLEAIRSCGLRVETPTGKLLIQPAQASDDPAQVGICDVVIVGVKTWQVTDAAHSMRSMVGSKTLVVPFQNGVEAPSQLAAVLGADQVLGGLCGTISYIVVPGRIRSVGDMHFVKFGELNKRMSERVERLRQVFQRAGVKVEVPADIEVAMWEKFLFVVPFGGVGAVTRAPIGVTRALPETRRMLEQGMCEILALARAHRVALSDEVIPTTLAMIDTLPPNATASLQRDIVDGKPSELEAWNGAVVRLGREMTIATPLHEFIYHSLLALESQARGSVQFPDGSP